jgi:mycothiol synthase
MNVELRAPRLDELEELTELINRDSAEVIGTREESVDSMRLWLTGPKLNPETDMRVALVEGEFRGYADVDDDPHPTYWADLRVPPSEPDEIREALVDWVEARARERAGHLLRCSAVTTDEATKRLLDARGYRLIRHFYRMRLELDDVLEEPEWPEGVSVRTMGPEEAETVYEVHQETFEDHWEHAREPLEEWKHAFMTEGFDPGLWFLVEGNGEIAGISLCRQHEAEPDWGVVRVLGVRKDWRRKRLGRALLLHSFHEFRRRGLRSAVLGVDAASLTGANRLYESVGMRVAFQMDIYEQQL